MTNDPPVRDLEEILVRPVRMRRRTTSLMAVAALTVLAATAVPAQAAEQVGTTISGATLSWGLSGEAGGGAYFGGCNFLSAGAAGSTGSSRVWAEADGFYSAEQGDVRIEKPTADGGWVEPTWATKCQGPTGAAVSAGSTTSFTGNRVVLSNGVGSTSSATGTGTVSWTGSFTIVFYGGMTYWTASDPTLTVDSSGNGTLTATASGYAASMDDTSVWEPITPTSITLANLKGVELDADGFTATPEYLGVSVTTTGTPQSSKTTANEAYWGSFPQSFVTFQERTGQSSYWYSSGGARDAAKPTTPLTVEYTAEPRYQLEPTVTASVAGTATGAVVTVEGSEFTAVTQEGDAGVYVGIAPAGGLPDVSTQAAASNFLTADWVTPARLADGTFTSTLTVDATKVDRTKSYAVYTWQAHGHSNTTQDTETAIDLVAALPAVVAPQPVPAPTFTANLAPKKSVVVGGSVALSAAASGTGVTYQWQTAAKGSSTFTNVAGATARTYTVKATSTKASGARFRVVATNVSGSVTSAATTVTVTKAKAKITAKLSKKKVSAKVKAKKRASVKVTVKASSVTVSGKVTVTFKKGKTAKKTVAKLKKGKATVRSPKLAKGTYKVTVKYSGVSGKIAAKTVKAHALKVTR